MKYKDFDFGSFCNYGTALSGWGTGNGCGSLPVVLTNYPTAQLTGAGAHGNNSSTGIFLVNAVIQGTDINAVIGRKMNMKSFYMRLTVFSPDNAWSTQDPKITPSGIVNTTVRVLVVYDSQANGIGLTTITNLKLTDILNVGATPQTIFATGASGYTNAHINLDNRDRFSIITDKTFDLSNMQGNASRNLKIFKKFKKGGLPTIFAGSAGTINTGAVYVIVGGSGANPVGSVPAAAQVTPINYAWFGTSRIRFVDA